MTAAAFGPADILVPQGVDPTLWSVVACDQYTSQPEYWARVDARVGAAPSTLRLVLPESELESPDVDRKIQAINAAMDSYQEEGLLWALPDSLIYVERTLDDGRVRRGLVGAVDLEQYSYLPGSDAAVRATEGTVLERIPPRVKVRENASIELPHVMLLCDDPDDTVIEPLADQTEAMEPLYGYELMERGGHIRGWRLTDSQVAEVEASLERLAAPDRFASRYDAEGKPVMVFAVGDGNHSLATAKECYEREKAQVPPELWPTLPSRFALCELGNLDDESLTFEPIHRVVFGVDPAELLADLRAAFPGAHEATAEDREDAKGDAHLLAYHYGAGEAGVDGAVVVPSPTAQLEVGTLQGFLDDWLQKHPEASVDYVHGADVVTQLSSEQGAIGFFLPSMTKDSLFRTVIHDGVLPRKTFSMGEAHDKRFYLEARRIRA